MLRTAHAEALDQAGVVGGDAVGGGVGAPQHVGGETLRGLHRPQVGAVGGAGDDAGDVDAS